MSNARNLARLLPDSSGKIALPSQVDGVVKGDQAQIDKYIADCQAVKAKYPKGS